MQAFDLFTDDEGEAFQSAPEKSPMQDDGLTKGTSPKHSLSGEKCGDSGLCVSREESGSEFVKREHH